MVDYGLLPPEINSVRIYTGPGSGPMLAAAAAWSALAADYAAAAAGHRSVISELTSGPWLGPASESLLSAGTPFFSWLDSSAVEGEQAASQAFAAAAAYEAAFIATVPPPVIAANRALLAALVATNFLGQNTPAIMATEALYMEMWFQDGLAMDTYATTAQQAVVLPQQTLAPSTSDGGTSADAAAATQAATNTATNSGTNLMTALQNLAPSLTSNSGTSTNG